MKKTVSTSIGGVVFHIEEDAYQRLSSYLQGILNYFSTFPEGREIYRDIEARIAELFQDALKANESEAISEADVERVTATMGSVDDFAAAQAEAEGDTAYTRPASGATATGSGTHYQTPKFGEGYNPASGDSEANKKQYATPNGTWYRVRKDRVVAGVLGGLAGRLGIDALWLRVLFVVLFFGLWITPPHGFGFLLFVVYVVLAFVLPTYPGEEEYTARKFYREPNGEVVGGVANGLAVYFQTDATLIRILFVCSVLFFGFGIGLYLLLWIFAPAAKTHTDRMRMQGDPINLSGFNERMASFTKAEPGQRSGFEKALLIPFEAAGVVLRALGTVLLGLARVIGAMIGVVLAVLGLAVITTAVIVIAQLLTYGSLASEHNSLINMHDPEAQAWLSAVPNALAATVIAFGIVLGISIILSAVSLIANKRIANRYVAGTLTAASILLVIAFFVQLPFFLRQFSEEGTFETAEYYSVPAQPAVFTVAVPEVAAPGGFRDDRIRLQIKPASGDSISLVQSAEGRGASRAEAVSAAEKVRYLARLENDTLLNLSRSFEIDPAKPYRLQRLRLVLKVPDNKPFRLSHQAVDMAYGDLYGVAENYSPNELAEHKLIFRRGALGCLDCPPKVERDEQDERAEDWQEDRTTSEDEDFTPRIDIETEDGKRANGKLESATWTPDGVDATVRQERTGERVQVHISADSIDVKKKP